MRAVDAAIAVAVVAVAAAIGFAAVDQLSLADEAMLLLFAILVAGLRGRGPGIVAAALAVAAYDFFFIPPRYTFAVSDLRHLITFAVMFAVGIGMGTVVARSRRRELRAQAEELRSSLLSTVSHDLRTPLAIISGTAQGLRESATPAQLEGVETILSETARLTSILTNLLSITRVESGATLRVEWVPVEELVGSALDRAGTALANRDVRIEVPGDLGAVVDPMLAEQLLVNLLENAGKHTPAGTPVEIQARHDGPCAVLEVSDRGPGLPLDAGKRLFDKFYRGPGTTAPGAGLGLAVCRGIAVAHGGRIEAHPHAGGGATFRVTLPGGVAPP